MLLAILLIITNVTGVEKRFIALICICLIRHSVNKYFSTNIFFNKKLWGRFFQVSIVMNKLPQNLVAKNFLFLFYLLILWFGNSDRTLWEQLVCFMVSVASAGLSLMARVWNSELARNCSLSFSLLSHLSSFFPLPLPVYLFCFFLSFSLPLLLSVYKKLFIWPAWAFIQDWNKQTNKNS